MSKMHRLPAESDPEYEQWLLSQHYSRRDILRMAGIGGAAVGASGLLGTGLAQASTRARATASAGWQKGPVNFIFLDTTEPDTLDPSLQTQFDSMLIIRNTYDTLTITNESAAKLAPCLATSWKPNHDSTQWTFKLRSGVHFIDGSVMDAAAVVLSMKRHLAIGSGSQAGYMLEGIKDVKASGSHEVVFTTAKPQPWLPYHMVAFPVISAKAIEAHRTTADPWAKTWFASNAAGTGAYKLTSWVKGTKITLAKNASWWNGPWLAGSIDNVTVQWETNPSTTVELIEKGAANFATEWSIDNALSMAGKSGFTLHKYDGTNTDPVIAFNQTKAPYDKLAVRQALQYAFDYSAMREYFRGYASPTSGVLPMNNEYVLKSLPEYKQNISKAKALLSKAGVSPSDLTGTCYTASGYPDLEAGGTILQSSIAALGGSIQVQAVPYGTIETDVTKVATSPALTSSLYNGTFTLDPTSFISEFLPGTFSSEFMRWDSGDLLKAYNQASEGTTQAEIVAGLNSAQKIIAADAPVIFGAQPQLLIPVPDYLEGYVMQQTFDEYPCLFFQLRLRAR